MQMLGHAMPSVEPHSASALFTKTDARDCHWTEDNYITKSEQFLM